MSVRRCVRCTCAVINRAYLTVSTGISPTEGQTAVPPKRAYSALYSNWRVWPRHHKLPARESFCAGQTVADVTVAHTATFTEFEAADAEALLLSVAIPDADSCRWSLAR